MSTTEGLYTILGLGKGATEEEIKKAYKNLAKIHHSDKGGSDEMMIKLNEAKNTLLNVELRSKYNDEHEEDEGTVSDAIHITGGKRFSEIYRQMYEESKNVKREKVKFDFDAAVATIVPSSPTFTTVEYISEKETEKLIYDQSPLSIAQANIDPIIGLAIYNKFFNNELPDSFTAIGDILRAKILLATGKIERMNVHLYSALLKMPTQQMYEAIHLLDTQWIAYVTGTIDEPDCLYTDKLQSNPVVRLLKKYEREIRKINEPFERAMAYIDMVMAADHLSSKVNALLLACVHLMKCENSWNVISSLLKTAFSLTYGKIDYFSQKYIYQRILDICYYMNLEDMLDTELTAVIEAVVKEYKLISVLVPFDIPFYNCLDLLYVQLVNVKYLTHKIRTRDNMTYYLFDGLWNCWIEPIDENEFDRTRYLLLLTMGDIAKAWSIMDVPFLSSKDGWTQWNKLVLHKSVHKHNPTTFGDIDGFYLNKATGELTLYLIAGDLFDMEDVIETFGVNGAGAFLTFDQVDYEHKSHPYQRVRYGPASIKGTELLATMLKCDYLLKMLSIGTEIANDDPYPFRQLESAVKPVRSKGANSAHRFWIEADKLDYNIDEKDDSINVLFGKANMMVKQHLLKHDKDGKLVDDDEDDEKEEKEAVDEHSFTEKQFAKYMTDNYDKIGTEYPVLLRLKALLKLTATQRLLSSIYNSIKENSTVYPSEMMDGIYRDTGYPHPSDYNTIERMVDDLCWKQGLVKSRVSNLSQIRNDIRNQILANDGNILNSLTTQLNKLYGCSITPYEMSDFFFGKNTVCTKIMEGKKKKFNWFSKGLWYVQTSERSNELVDDNDLIPSVFRKSDGYRVYGGVNMSLNLQQAQMQLNQYKEGGKNWTVGSMNGQDVYSHYKRDADSVGKTREYWRAANCVIDHVTDHGSMMNVHYTTGSRVQYSQQSNGLWLPK